jgi:hypothetical protein
MRICSILAVAAIAGAANADTVKLQFAGKGAGSNVNITGPGYAGGVFAGQLRHAFTDGTGSAAAWTGTQTTFCVEVGEVVTNIPMTYQVKDLAEVPGYPGAMQDDRAEAVSVLYGLAAGAQFGTNNTLAAAFQVALWELVFDFEFGDSSSIDLVGGAFKLNTTGSVRTQAELWLSQISGNYGTGSTPLVGLHNHGKQDQVLMVPLPAPLAMGLAGLVAVAGVRRLRAR